MKKGSKIVLDEKDVNDYVNNKINLEELAQITGCSRFTAAKKLRELGRKDVIDRINENRSRGPAKLTLIDRANTSEGKSWRNCDRNINGV